MCSWNMSLKSHSDVVPWYLRDWLMCPMCHAFPFPFTFFFQLPTLHPFLCASGFHYHPHSLLFYACTFLQPHFHPTHLLSHLYSQQTLFQTLLSSCLSLCLAAILPAPSSILPLTSCSYLLCLPPHITTPLSMEKCLLFPSFEAFSRFFQ